MESKELRPGNFISNLKGEWQQVIAVSKTSVAVDSKVENGEQLPVFLPLDQFEPIVLTEEILLQAGYGKHKWEKQPSDMSDNLYLYNDLWIALGYDSKFCLVSSNAPESEYPIAEILHLHQLQNLYVDLRRDAPEFKRN